MPIHMDVSMVLVIPYVTCLDTAVALQFHGDVYPELIFHVPFIPAEYRGDAGQMKMGHDVVSI